MTHPLPLARLTASFSEPRPLGGPCTHIHGAVDLAPSGPGRCLAPVSGEAQYLQFIRPSLAEAFLPDDKPALLAFPMRHYYYDLYGGLLTIKEEKTSRLHILTHFWGASLWEHTAPTYIESRKTGRFPCFALVRKPFHVVEGQPLLPVGNAGFSTGPHIHWEIHPTSDYLTPHRERLDPTKLLEEASHA